MDSIQNEITATFFGEVDDIGQATAFFSELLAQSEGEELELLINSPGGAVFEGINIASLLQRRSGSTTTTATGLAASIATVVLMAGDTVQMDKDAFLMIHDAWAFEMGDAKEMRKTARLLDKISAQIAIIYTNQIGKAGKLIDGDRDKTIERMRQLMRAETWLNADEALKLGLVDKVVNAKEKPETVNFTGSQQSDVEAKFRACLKSYKNTPNNILHKYNNKAMEDKKSLWQAIKAFFGAEIKAEAEALEAIEPETTTIENQNEEMTNEEMIEALKAQGFDVSEAEKVEETTAPEVEAVEAPQAKENSQLMAKLESLEAELAKQKEALKAAKFEASAKPTGKEGTESKKKGSKMSEQNAAAFQNLANILNNQ